MTPHPLRDSRLHGIPWLGPEKLALLRTHRVAILGVGNIGGEAARHLAMLGIPLLLVDRGIVEPANLGTQGFIEEDIGLPKVRVRRRALRWMNPDCSIEALALDIETMGFAALREAALWLCCVDSLQLRVRINEMALRLSRPWIDAAIDGTGRAFARVAAYGSSGDSPCFVCGYGPEGLQELIRQGTAVPCHRDDAGTPDATPTLAVSATGALAASVQIHWALTHLLQQQDRSGHEWLINVEESQSRAVRRLRDPHCAVSHEPWTLTPGLTPTNSLHDAFTLAESLLGPQVTMTLLHRSLVTELSCARCGYLYRPYRVLDSLKHELFCCSCGGQRRTAAMSLLDRMTRTDVADFIDLPLHQLGIPPEDVLLAGTNDRTCHLLVAGVSATAPGSLDAHPDKHTEVRDGSRL
jgi:molybdopterin/thiamine biosynthesis adenylyltransferase